MLRKKIFGASNAKEIQQGKKSFEVSIDDIKSKFQLSEYVSKYVKLKKSGKATFTGLCPFHEDKNPSLSIDDEKGVFICGGCKKAGNIVHFHSFIEKLDKRDSFIYFAQQLTGRSSFKNNGYLSELNNLFIQNIDKSNSIREFLEKRGINKETIEKFEIGFCMGKEHEFLSPDSLEESKKAGLVSEKNWMSFTRRAMFPIRNMNGSLIAFGGRAIDETQKIKYLNSSESNDFKKGLNVFGGNHLRISPNEPVVVVEGFLDVVIAHQNGFKNVVGAMGTNISKEMILELFKKSDHIVFCLDPDNAGVQGSLRNIEVAADSITEGKRISFATLGDGLDPDEFIHKHGAKAFSEQIRLAEGTADFLCRTTEESFDLSSADERSQYRAMMKEQSEKFINCPSLKEEIIEASKLRTLSHAYRNIVIADHSNMTIDEIDIIKEQIEKMQYLVNRSGRKP